MDDEIRVQAKICGKRRCTNQTAKVDTGAFGTVVSSDVARQADLTMTGETIKAKGVSKRGVTLRVAKAKVCLPKCGCREQTVYVAEPGVLNDSVLLGMDYLKAAKATLDTASGKIRCRCRGRRR